MPSSLQIKGGISINLFEKIQDEGDRKKGVLVTVPDTGNGIIVKFLQGYFQNWLKSYRGTGLGLFICKSTIDAKGGYGLKTTMSVKIKVGLLLHLVCLLPARWMGDN